MDWFFPSKDKKLKVYEAAMYGKEAERSAEDFTWS